MNDENQKLSNLSPEDQSEIINQRKAQSELIQRASSRGNWFASQAEVLDLMAKQYGINVEYSEDLDDEEI